MTGPGRPIGRWHRPRAARPVGPPRSRPRSRRCRQSAAHHERLPISTSAPASAAASASIWSKAAGRRASRCRSCRGASARRFRGSSQMLRMPHDGSGPSAREPVPHAELVQQGCTSGASVSPTRGRSKRPRSSSATDRPAVASRRAVAAPAGPPPTTTTSYSRRHESAQSSCPSHPQSCQALAGARRGRSRARAAARPRSSTTPSFSRQDSSCTGSRPVATVTGRRGAGGVTTSPPRQTAAVTVRSRVNGRPARVRPRARTRTGRPRARSCRKLPRELTRFGRGEGQRVRPNRPAG